MGQKSWYEPNHAFGVVTALNKTIFLFKVANNPNHQIYLELLEQSNE